MRKVKLPELKTLDASLVIEKLEKHLLLLKKIHFTLSDLMMTVVRGGQLEREKDKIKNLLEIMESNINQIRRTAETILDIANENQPHLSDDELEK